MHGPAVVTFLLAAVALGSGGYCLRRLGAAGHTCADGHRPDREADGVEAVMGLGMAGMALLPGPFWGWLYALLGGALLLGGVGRGARVLRVHRLHHGIGALAMAYMALAMAGAPGHLHHSAQVGLPLLTGALLLYFGGYSLWTGSRLLTTPAGPLHAAAAPLTQACRVAMGIGMFAMLLTM